jgi:hypothetical protein
VLGAGEAIDFSEHGNHGQCDHGANPRHGLEPFYYLAPQTGALAEPEVERTDPFGGLTLYRVAGRPSFRLPGEKRLLT